MGKPTGFMEYERRELPAEEPLIRLRHWGEFHTRLPREERQRQAGRCMSCCVPFCQSGMELLGKFTGCPLHNLIPEWNDLLYSGNNAKALERLLKTNSFPEFTGRVCPALCESACTCGLSDEAVSVRENELYIAEDAWKKGLMEPRPPRHRTGKRVAVVGSGPAGLAAAERLNSRGHTVTVIESADRPGGLLMYGIPNMKLDKKIVERRIRHMEAEGVIFRLNTRVGRDVSGEELREAFDAVVLCVGAGTPRELNVPGREAKGAFYALEYLERATRCVLDGSPNREAEGKDVVVVGLGDTGADCVATALRQGCRSVAWLSRRPRAAEEAKSESPWPHRTVGGDSYALEEAVACLGSDPRVFETGVKELLTDETGALRAVVTVTLAPKTDPESGKTVLAPVEGSEAERPCQLLLIASGFRGAERDAAESLGVSVGPVGIETPDGYATGEPGVFAAGDGRRGASLVVWAIREGRECARQVDEYLMGYTNL